jgi:hypothetical protein
VANGSRLAGGAEVLGGRAYPAPDSLHFKLIQQIARPLNLLPSVDNNPIGTESRLFATQHHYVSLDIFHVVPATLRAL